jgi:NADP-dependent 3-hydroxy acid dehydrogenase YdfG
MSDDIVVVTGATAGIGEACCRHFSKLGAKIVAVGRRADRLEKLAAELGPEVHILPLDIRDRGAVEAAFAGLPESHRDVTVLVNNAGLALGSQSLLEGTAEEWETMIATNVNGVLYATQALLPGMIERRRGHVFMVSSVGGVYTGISTVYGGTKAFVRHASLSLRKDLMGTPIRVTCVEPGAVATEFRAVRSYREADAMPEQTIGPECMSADDIAEAIVFCHRLPANVNVNQIEMMPVAHAPGGVARGAMKA